MHSFSLLGTVVVFEKRKRKENERCFSRGMLLPGLGEGMLLVRVVIIRRLIIICNMLGLYYDMFIKAYSMTSSSSTTVFVTSLRSALSSSTLGGS